MLQPRRVRVSELNASLVCALCSGYLIDATTIIECLHSFCRSCIVRYLQSNKYCPVCDVQVHKTKPLMNIRPDQILQDMVYKLVPGLFENEMRRRREWFSRRDGAELAAAVRASCDEHAPVCLSLEYEADRRSGGVAADAGRRYLRCPPAVSLQHLHKLLRAKYGLSQRHRIELMYAGEPLQPQLTLADIAYMYLWRTRTPPLHLTYRIYEAAREDAAARLDAQSRPTEGAGAASIADERRETSGAWKEVQLQISENGVMCVTNIGTTQEAVSDDSVTGETCTAAGAHQPIPDTKSNPKVEEEPCSTVADSTESSVPPPPDDQPAVEVATEAVDAPPAPSTRHQEESGAIVAAAAVETTPVAMVVAEPVSEPSPPPAKRPRAEEPTTKTTASSPPPATVKNVHQLSSSHPLKIHAQRRKEPTAAPLAPGIQNSRVGIVPRRAAPLHPAYKTLRDPPRAWNPQLPPRPTGGAGAAAASQHPHAPAKPPKFFKVRNNVPRYLGNPASGVKPMYPPPVTTAAAAQATPAEGARRPATPRPLPAAALKINQSTVPILNPLRDRTKPPGEHRRAHAKNGAQQRQPSPPAPPPVKKDKPQLSFTPPNPFVPNLGSPNLAAPNHFLFGPAAVARPYFPAHHLPPPPASTLYYQQRYATAAAAAAARSPRPAPPTPTADAAAPPPRDPKLAAA